MAVTTAERTRYQQAGELASAGLPVAAIADRMEIKVSTAAKMIELARCRQAITDGTPEVGCLELTERMCRVYPEDERRDWIRAQMAEWERLRENNRKAGR